MSYKVFILIYIIVISLITFAIRGRDKRKAAKQGRRISEKTLFKLTLAGGGLGALTGMSFFRHKTIKSSFLRRFRLIIITQLIILSYIFIRL